MPTYLHPGVYVEEIPSGSKPIEGVATSTASFVGYTTKGPLGEPVLLTKLDDYQDLYGGIRDTAVQLGDPMGHSVTSFFQNGGTKAYVVRITSNWEDDLTRDAVKAVGYMDHPSEDVTDQALRFTAVNEGVWANGMVVQLSENAVDSDRYDVEVGWLNNNDQFVAEESYSSLSMDEEDPLYIEGAIDDVSQLITVDLVDLEGGGVIYPEDFYRGVSISAALNPAALDFSAIVAPADRTLTMAADGVSFDIEIAQQDYSGAIEDLAADIASLVQTGASATRRTNFTCTVEGGNTLVLTSGTREPESSLVVDDAAGLAPTLLLGLANGGTERTGEESAQLAWETTAGATNESTLAGGVNGSAPDLEDYQAVFTAFEKYRDISIMCVPGQNWNGDGLLGDQVIDAAIAHAELMKSRMVILDPPPSTELTTELAVSQLGLPTSTYSVLYYPWPQVANPFYHAETNPGAFVKVLVPPSGFAAGMWSKIDGRRGVWKAPAGVEARLLGQAGPEFVVEDAEQDALNPLGVNCFRTLPNFGSVIWGSRTLSTRADPEWRYVPVRRTAIMIEQSLYNGIQWAVFEPNDHRLWSSLRVNIETFMNGLFRSGAFQGEKASDAYFVRCGLGDTMTQGNIDAGQVIVIVGFAPLKPAEFVIVRIQQKVAQQ